MTKKERGLGRGLEALLPSAEPGNAPVMDLEINRIVPQANQPRKNFEEETLKELVNSIKEHGVLQPVLVRPKASVYEIVAGERRWRAAQLAGLSTLPAVVKDIEDIEAAEISLVENLQREDLSAIEEAIAFKNLLEQYHYTQEQVANRVGKSRVYIANTIRLLNLSPEIVEMIDKKKITAGHARALLGLKTSREQIAAAHEIIENKLSVRQTEGKAKTRVKNKKKGSGRNPDLLELEDRLQSILGTRVEITPQRRGGKLEILYYNEDDLERILEILGA